MQQQQQHCFILWLVWCVTKGLTNSYGYLHSVEEQKPTSYTQLHLLLAPFRAAAPVLLPLSAQHLPHDPCDLQAGRQTYASVQFASKQMRW